MNALLNWASGQSRAQQFLPDKLTRVTDPEVGTLPDGWKSATASKVLVHRFSDKPSAEQLPDLNLTTMLGGMCLLNTVEMKAIHGHNVEFKSELDFETWYSGWYPRIDQLHDSVGIPPRSCRKVIYVSEDNFFAGRIASYTGLRKEVIQEILRRTNDTNGHPALVKYLSSFGYRGDVSVIYTSDIEKEMCVALRIWERILGQSFRTCDRDFAKVELMYTSFWLDILGISNQAIIYESTNKMVLKGWLKLNDWFRNNPYGCGVNHNLGIVGYLPFLTSKGDASTLSYTEVPNRQNYNNFVIAEDDVPWYVINMLFSKKIVVDSGPFAIPNTRVAEMINGDLSQYFV